MDTHVDGKCPCWRTILFHKGKCDIALQNVALFVILTLQEIKKKGNVFAEYYLLTRENRMQLKINVSVIIFTINSISIISFLCIQNTAFN